MNELKDFRLTRNLISTLTLHGSFEPLHDLWVGVSHEYELRGFRVLGIEIVPRPQKG